MTLKQSIERGLIFSVLVVIGVIGIGMYTGSQKVEYQAPEVVEEIVSAPVVEKSNVEKAREQLEEAKRLLNDEESLILAEIDAREDRLEEIREIRLSFTEAPNQQN